MLATQQKLTVASYGVPVPGALLLDKEDAEALASEAPGGIIEHDDYVWRVVSVEFEEYSSERGAIVVTLEPIAAMSV